MTFRSPKNPNSHLTVKNRDWPSFPVKYLHSKGLIKGKTLDFGCGLGLDIKYLKKMGVDIRGYDPVYLPNWPDMKFDTILCSYVLNILMKDEQTHVLMDISELLNPNGKAYITVRRDIINNEFIFNPKQKAKTYRCNVVLPFKSILKKKHCEIYEYQHFNKINHSKKNCPFCNPEEGRELIVESATFYAMYDKYPVSKGHALIIPKNHIKSFFDLNVFQHQASNFVLNRVRLIVQDKYKPDGFNIGINLGKDAGQTIEHLHIHLIPRYKGDCENPVGGVRNIFPEKADYLKR